MKNKITMFLLGGLTFLTIGAGVATSADVLTVKPSVPKSVTVKDFSSEGDSSNVAKYIRSKIGEGYIVKSVSAANYSNSYSTWIVVMEKY